MADSKITALTALTSADPANDMIPIVDVSDTPPASGNTKRISINNILAASGTATLASATITGDLTVDTSTLKVDATNDRVGIGTATPISSLQVLDGDITVTTGGSFCGFNGTRQTIPGSAGVQLSRLHFSGYSTGTTYVQGASVQAFSNAAWSASSAPSYLSFQTTPSTSVTLSERMRIEAAGDVTVSTGNVVMGTSGKGIDFSATAGTGTSELLADYEEGTWTPTIGGTATYTAQAGVYTKVGRLVTATFDITILLRGTGDIATVSGLPFAASANVGAAVAVSYFSGLATSAASIYGYVNSSTMAFNTIAAGGGTGFSGSTVITNGTRLSGTAVFMV